MIEVTMVNANIQTNFLLIKGEIQALPVQARIKDWLLAHLSLADNDFTSGNGSASLNGLALILGKIKKHTMENIYAPLLNGLNQLRQQITCYIENDSLDLQISSESMGSLSPKEVSIQQDESDCAALQMSEPSENAAQAGENRESVQADFAVKNHGAYSTSQVVESLQEPTIDKKLIVQGTWSHFSNPGAIEDGHLSESILEPLQLNLDYDQVSPPDDNVEKAL
jgi:hypothetical protein